MNAIDRHGQPLAVEDVVTRDGTDLYEVTELHEYDGTAFVVCRCIRSSTLQRNPVRFGEPKAGMASLFAARLLNPASWARQRRQERMDKLKAWIGWVLYISVAVGLLAALYALP